MLEKLKELLAEYPEDSEEYRILAEAIKKFHEYLINQKPTESDAKRKLRIAIDNHLKSCPQK